MKRTTAEPSLVNARRGYAVSLHVERAGRWVGGTYAFYNASVEGRLAAAVGAVAARALERLYPGRVPAALLAR